MNTFFQYHRIPLIIPLYKMKLKYTNLVLDYFLPTIPSLKQKQLLLKSRTSVQA